MLETVKQTLKICYNIHSARFVKYVRPFFNIMNVWVKYNIRPLNPEI